MDKKQAAKEFIAQIDNAIFDVYPYLCETEVWVLIRDIMAGFDWESKELEGKR